MYREGCVFSTYFCIVILGLVYLSMLIVKYILQSTSNIYIQLNLGLNVTKHLIAQTVFKHLYILYIFVYFIHIYMWVRFVLSVHVLLCVVVLVYECAVCTPSQHTKVHNYIVYTEYEYTPLYSYTLSLSLQHKLPQSTV